jgi:hypothetical protein
MMAAVIISEQFRNHNNYILIEQPTFQSAGRPPAGFFGQASTEDCNSWGKLIAIALICA